MRQLTFGQKMGLGFAAVVALAIVIASVAAYSLHSVVTAKDRVISVNAENLIDAARLQASTARKSADSRAYLLSGYPEFLQKSLDDRRDFLETLAQLRRRVYTD